MPPDHPLWAHSPSPGSDKWHHLRDHLLGAAQLARRFAEPFGGGELAYWLGLLHDCGKAAEAWQRRLIEVADAGGTVGIDHKTLGTKIAIERGLWRFAEAIFAHHGGLLDWTSFEDEYEARLNRYAAGIRSAESVLPKLLPELSADLRLRSVVPQQWKQNPLIGEMAMRLVFSALVDADVLDTQAFHQQLSAPRVRPDADFGHLVELFERRRAEMLTVRPESPIDPIRNKVYADCLAAAEGDRGIFRLHAPTGVGKTLASAGFALRHAARHNLRRVIVAVPFLTITEQNARVYRAMLDEPGVVLEHHSQVDFDAEWAGLWARQAAENWDAPFIVTTFVQLFESLFARKPAAMRRVHRLAGSVIVLDEVQALPHDMLVPILDGLRLLVDHFGASVLLSSATQPKFWALSVLKESRYTDIVDDVASLNATTRRVTYEWRLDPKPTLAEIADDAAKLATDTSRPARDVGGAAMVVVNTTADARTVYERWRAQGLTDIAWHLSTRMCPAHRRRVLDTVTERLRANQPVLLATTQLVEAGVDVDFPVVFRAMAPADSLLQAAGRANREGQLPRGRVIVFDPADGGQPPSYRLLVDEARSWFGPDKADPDDVEALENYYQGIYLALNLEDPKHIGQQIQQARREWDFETVADGPEVSELPMGSHRDKVKGLRERSKAFRIIRDQGISVVTPKGAATQAEQDELVELIERIRYSPIPNLRDLRRLQPYTTTVHSDVLRDKGVAALMKPIIGSRVVEGALVEWLGDYDEATGINLDPRIEEFIL